MVINEIFYSIQGEGFLASVPSVFVRVAGCPLRCTWCDTKYALAPDAGEDLTIPAITRKVNRWNCRYVVITGGEPIISPQIAALTSALKKRGKHVTIETACPASLSGGVAYVDKIACDLMSISPKTSNSGKTTPDPFFGPVKQLIAHYPYQLKFVVESPKDLQEIQRLVASLKGVDPARVMLMPQAKTRRELLARSPMAADLCKQTGYTFCNRLQILLYDGEKGK